MRNILLLMIIVLLLSSCGEDTTSPQPTITAPTFLSAILISGSAVQLNWVDNSTDEEGFNIERKEVDGEYESIGSAGIDQTTFTDSLLSPNTQYYYRIAAFKDLDRSDWCYSNVILTPLDINAPSNLVVVYLASDQVDLNWTDNSDYETGFLLQRQIATGDFVNLAVVDADVIEYSDTGLEPVVEYTYRVSAQFDGGQTDWSNEVVAVTPPDLQEIQFGSDETLEVMTWNIENFPKNNLIIP